MENTTLITVGLPFFNNEKTLLNAIKSVCLQTHKNWELILINDGSTDGSLAIATAMAARDGRINLLHDSENRGLVARLNQIIALSKGEFIARMDADDLMMTERLEKELQVFLKDPTIDVVATAAYTIDEYDQLIGIRGMTEINPKKVLKKSLLDHPTILVKAAWYKKNLYDDNFLRAEDYELWCRTVSYTKFYRITEPLFFYREGNVSLKNYLLSMKTVKKIILKYGEGQLSKTEMQIEVLKTHVKSTIYQIMGWFNLQYILTAKRNAHLTEVQKLHAQKMLDLIKNKPL